MPKETLEPLETHWCPLTKCPWGAKYVGTGCGIYSFLLAFPEGEKRQKIAAELVQMVQAEDYDILWEICDRTLWPGDDMLLPVYYVEGFTASRDW